MVFDDLARRLNVHSGWAETHPVGSQEVGRGHATRRLANTQARFASGTWAGWTSPEPEGCLAEAKADEDALVFATVSLVERDLD